MVVQEISALSPADLDPHPPPDVLQAGHIAREDKTLVMKCEGGLKLQEENRENAREVFLEVCAVRSVRLELRGSPEGRFRSGEANIPVAASLLRIVNVQDMYLVPCIFLRHLIDREDLGVDFRMDTFSNVVLGK